MRLVTASEMKEIDRHAIETVGIPSMVLMENAGLKVIFTLEKILSGLRGKRFTVVCGKGNNGGDGLVIARHLFNNRISVNIFVVGRKDELSLDSAANCRILHGSGFQPIFMSSRDDIDKLRVALEFSDYVVDAIFGTGFSGQIEGYAREVVKVINESSAKKIAVDVPSGLCATSGKVSNNTVKADITIALAFPKVGLFLYPGRDFAGEVWVADIGIPNASCERIVSKTHLISKDLASSVLPPRLENSHKGIFGHVLILGGSKQYQGAGVLASYGALRSGVGLVTLGLSSSVAANLTCEVLPDVIVRRFNDDDGAFLLMEDDIREFAGVYRAIVAGPGWGRGKAQRDSLRILGKNWAGGLVLDADALAAAGDFRDFSCRGTDLVLTPHLGEMSRLCGKPIPQIQDDLIGTVREFIERFPSVVVLKSSTTIIGSPDGKIYLCARPNSGLAKGGSGDLLAGLIGGLMAQGLSGINAAIIGAFLHSEAGEIARLELGPEAMTVSEVASLIPRAFKRLRGDEKSN